MANAGVVLVWLVVLVASWTRFRKASKFLFFRPASVADHPWLAVYLIADYLSLAVFFLLVTGGAGVLAGRLSRHITLPWRGFSIAFGFLLLILAMNAYISRFERLLDDHTIFGGVTYTDAHVILTGMLVVSAALVLGALIAFINAVRSHVVVGRLQRFFRRPFVMSVQAIACT